MKIGKELKSVVFMRGPYKGYELLNVALGGTEYLKKAVKKSGLGKKTKDLIKQAFEKT